MLEAELVLSQFAGSEKPDTPAVHLEGNDYWVAVALHNGPSYGYKIAQTIAKIRGRDDIQTPAIYKALARMEKSEPAITEKTAVQGADSRREHWQLTQEGKSILAENVRVKLAEQLTASKIVNG